MQVDALRGRVPAVHQYGSCPNALARTHGSQERVPEQHSTQPLTVATLIDR